MKISELKEFIVKSLNADSDAMQASKKLEEAGVVFRFSDRFTDMVLDRIYSTKSTVVRDVEFIRNLNFVFYRIALTGAAAILILLISIYIIQGSLSFDSFLGLSDSYDETILCLLTGN